MGELYFDYFSCTKFSDNFVRLLEDMKCEYSINKVHGNSVLTVLNHNLISDVLNLIHKKNISVNLTRLDVCFDFLMPFSDVLLPKDYSNLIYDGKGRLNTIYIGSRRSDRFARIYDKTIESDLDYDLTRFEFEFKGELCNELGYRLLFFGYDDFCNRLCSLITKFCINHGIDLNLPNPSPYVNYRLINVVDKIKSDTAFLHKFGKKFYDIFSEYNLTLSDLELIIEGSLNLDEI